MNKLEEARLRINEIDDELIKLFVERMEAVNKVVEYKIENNMPVLDSSREADIKKDSIKKLNNKAYEKYYLMFLDGLFNSSKAYQKDIIEKRK